MKSHRTLKQMLVNPKDSIPIQHRVGIVYRVSCKDCPKGYIGQSGHTLECRMKEHKRAVERGNTDMSAIAQHAWRNNHRVDWEAVNVLDVNTEWYKICTIESWHIYCTRKTRQSTGILGHSHKYTAPFDDMCIHSLSISFHSFFLIFHSKSTYSHLIHFHFIYS